MASSLADNKRSGTYLRIMESCRDQAGTSRVKTRYHPGRLARDSATQAQPQDHFWSEDLAIQFACETHPPHRPVQ